MKESTALKLAIQAVASTLKGDRLIEVIRILMTKMEAAEWTEAREEARNAENS